MGVGTVGVVTRLVLRSSEAVRSITSVRALRRQFARGNAAAIIAIALSACAGATGGCLRGIDHAEQQAEDDALPGQLADVIAAVKQRAPSATIVAVAYPRIIPAGPP